MAGDAPIRCARIERQLRDTRGKEVGSLDCGVITYHQSLESRPYEDRATRTQRNFFFQAISSIEQIVAQQIDSHNGWPYVFPPIPRELWYRYNLLRLVRNDLSHRAESGFHRVFNLKRLHLFIHQEIDHWSRGLTAMRTKWEAVHERPGGLIGVSGAVTLDV
jgi:hypothetical protein